MTQNKVKILVARFEKETEKYLLFSGCNANKVKECYRVEVSDDKYSGICVRVYIDLDKQSKQKLADILTELIRNDDVDDYIYNAKGYVYVDNLDGAILYETIY